MAGMAENSSPVYILLAKPYIKGLGNILILTIALAFALMMPIKGEYI